MTTNSKIRAKLAITGVKQFEAAKVMGIDETSLSRKLRNEPSNAEKEL